MNEATTPSGQRPAIERANYFAGQALTAGLLNQNLAGEWERRWTHNRALHGSGIVGGLTVDGETGGVEVTVEPGHAIDPIGRELILTGPRTLQIPPVPGTAAADGTVTPASYVLVARWDETPTGVLAAGSCGTSGVESWLEEPQLQFLEEVNEFPPNATSVVPLATVRITSCLIYDLDFARRRVLGERPLPFVDAGVYTPEALQWRVIRSSGLDSVPYGLAVTVDTSVAGFGSSPIYQVRLAGTRWGEVESGESTVVFLFWTPEANIVGSTSTSIEVEVAITSVQTPQYFSELGISEWTTLGAFMDLASLDDDALRVLVTEELQWAITWVGVEGQL